MQVFFAQRIGVYPSCDSMAGKIQFVMLWAIKNVKLAICHIYVIQFSYSVM